MRYRSEYEETGSNFGRSTFVSFASLIGRALLCSLFLVLPWSGASAIAPTLKELAMPESFFSATLSSDGRYLAGVVRRAASSSVAIIDLDTPNSPPVLHQFGDIRVWGLEWATTDRVLVRTAVPTNVHTQKPISLAAANADPQRLRWIRRLVSLSLKDSSITQMLRDRSALRYHTQLTGINNLLPDDPEHIILPAISGATLNLYKVNVVDGSSELVAKGDLNTTDWFTDRKGAPVLMYAQQKTSRKRVVSVRDRGGKGRKMKWRKLRTLPERGPWDEDRAPIFNPIAPGPDANTYYVLGRLDGSDFTELYLYNYEADKVVEVLASVPGYDLTGVKTNAFTGEVTDTWYDADRQVQETYDAGAQKHMNKLVEYFGDQVDISRLESVRDNTRWLVYANGPGDPGSYHIYDVGSGEVSLVAEQYGDLSDRQFARVDIVNYLARDGLRLTGYLTEPSQVDNSKAGARPPLIIMPHGGPVSRDRFGFNRHAQALASLGYQVFQPNFRGSAGFGKKFSELSYGQWGRLMQDDVDDALAHLVKQKKVAKGQACIAGSSYGGFAALSAATRTPSLYRCHIAISAVTDLVSQMKRDRGRYHHASDTYLFLTKQMGDPRKEQKVMMAHSPAQNVERITGPVLLIHGDADGRVPFSQSELMLEKMRTAGKTAELIRIKNAGHSFFVAADQLKSWEAQRSFLERHLPIAGGK